MAAEQSRPESGGLEDLEHDEGAHLLHADILNVADLKRLLIAASSDLQQQQQHHAIITRRSDIQWRGQLRARIRADGQHLERLL